MPINVNKTNEFTSVWICHSENYFNGYYCRLSFKSTAIVKLMKLHIRNTKGMVHYAHCKGLLVSTFAHNSSSTAKWVFEYLSLYRAISLNHQIVVHTHTHVLHTIIVCMNPFSISSSSINIRAFICATPRQFNNFALYLYRILIGYKEMICKWIFGMNCVLAAWAVLTVDKIFTNMLIRT